MSNQTKLWDKFLASLKGNNIEMTKNGPSYEFRYAGVMPINYFDEKDLKGLMGEITREWNFRLNFDEIKSNLGTWFDDFGSLDMKKQDEIANKVLQSFSNVKNTAKEILANTIQKEKFVVNFYGSPGAGKSTMATNFQNYLSQFFRFQVAYVKEYATELIQKEQFELLKNQPYVSMMQGKNLLDALDKLSNIAISDSPIDLGYIYNKDKNQSEKVDSIIKQTKARYTEIPIFIKHDENSLKNYSENGRVHNKEQSLEIQSQLLETFKDKDFLVVDRNISMGELFKKIEEWVEKQFNISFAVALNDNCEIKGYEGIFPEPYKNLQEVCEFLGVQEVDNQYVWEKTIDYMKEKIDFNSKNEEEIGKDLSFFYRRNYAEEICENLKDRINKIFDDSIYLTIDGNSELEIERGMFYFHKCPIHDINDFKDALIYAFEDMNREIKELSGNEFANGSDINEAIKFQKNIAEFLTTKFGVNLVTPKYVPEPVSKFEQDLANQVKM